MAQMAAYMSPEATENFKNSMRAGEIMASSFKRMFPNWDQMTEEQKRSVMNNPDIQGKLQAREQFAREGNFANRQNAYKQERSRLKTPLAGPI
jgi:hypothetical protein